MTRPHVWTVPEILALPEFGIDSGWFYGLVRNDKNHVRLAEIIPGTGWCTPFLTPNPKWWYRAARDLFAYQSHD